MSEYDHKDPMRNFQGLEVLAGDLHRKDSTRRIFMKNVRAQVPGDAAREREEDHNDFVLLHESVCSFKPTEGLSFSNLGRRLNFVSLDLKRSHPEQSLETA